MPKLMTNWATFSSLLTGGDDTIVPSYGMCISLCFGSRLYTGTHISMIIFISEKRLQQDIDITIWL